MRAVIDIPDSLVTQLDALAAAGRMSRAELMRRALATYVTSEKPRQMQRYFGLWQDRQDLQP